MEEESLFSILRKHASVFRPIELRADLVRDLGIDGDDADAVFEELQSLNPIELPKERLARCFHSEGELLSGLIPLRWLLHELRMREEPPLRELAPLTVGDLVELYNEGQLIN